MFKERVVEVNPSSGWNKVHGESAAMSNQDLARHLSSLNNDSRVYVVVSIERSSGLYSVEALYQNGREYKNRDFYASTMGMRDLQSIVAAIQVTFS